MPSISFQAQSHDIDTYYRSENLLRKDCNEFAQLLLHVVSSSGRVSQSILWRRSWIHCTNSPFAALFQLSCFSEILLWAKNLRFHLRLADSDLLQLLSDSVPPVDLQRVGVFRVVCKKHQKEAGESFDFWLNHCITMTESFILTCCGTHTQNIRRWTICTLPRLKSIWLEKINVWNPTSVANFGDISCVFKVGCEELQWLTLQTCNAAFRGWLWRCSMPIWNTPRQLALKTSRPWRLGWIERKPMRIDRCPNFVIGFQTSKSLICYYLQTWIAPTCWLSQGGLDLQYLQHRYQRGKDWNDEYMRSHHLYVVNEVTSTLSEAHAELLKFQSSQGDGGDSLLDKILRWWSV